MFRRVCIEKIEQGASNFPQSKLDPGRSEATPARARNVRELAGGWRGSAAGRRLGEGGEGKSPGRFVGVSFGCMLAVGGGSDGPRLPREAGVDGK